MSDIYVPSGRLRAFAGECRDAAGALERTPGILHDLATDRQYRR